MQYEERIRISTPEGVDVELPLAGLGSRLAAAVIDLGIQVVLLVALALAIGIPLFATGSAGRLGSYALLAYVVGAFLMLSGYHVLFETLAAGRTPGKRMVGIRVVRATGAPITFRASAVRNLVRLVDQDLTSGVVGIVSILATRRAQRIGDLAAGTIVVRDRGDLPATVPLAPPPVQAVAWDVGAVTDADLEAVATFLQRRDRLPAPVRERLAREIADRLRPRVVGAGDALDAEAFLSAVYAIKARGR